MFAATATELVWFDGQGWSPVQIDSDPGRPIRGLQVRPHLVEIWSASGSTASTEGIVRTRPWSCRATETACADVGDGVLDALDSDCP